MANRPALELRQSQNLVMTQQLQQSIKLLQLPAQELQEFIFAELQRNPLLTVADGDGENPSAPDREGEEWQETTEDAVTSAMDAAEENWWGEDAAAYEPGGRPEKTGDGSTSLSEAIEQRVSDELSLQEHIREQINHLITDPTQRLLAVHLTDMLDDSGYLWEDTTPLEQTLGAEKALIEEVILRLQSCEPTGVFARSLKECLRLQLEERGLLDEPMRLLLIHLDLLAEGEMKKLAKLCHLDEAGLQKRLAVIRTLDPKPGHRFQHDRAETLIPDILLRRGPDRQWRVEVNPEALPKVLINRQYYEVLSDKVKSRDDKKFLNEHLSQANWLIKALDQRAVNMLKVAGEIVRWQKDFLERGIHYLKPMRLSDIAAQAGVHESTVSRISAHKYMATPRGTFEMKYFFSTGVGGEEGEALSSRTIMHEIKQMIARESPSDILSDDTIARVLKERGMDVARRTVVKYRKILEIPSSVERRRIKQRQSS